MCWLACRRDRALRAAVDPRPPCAVFCLQQPTLYWPIYGNGYSVATIVVRAFRNADSLAIPIQRIVGRLDTDLPVADVMTLREAVAKSTVNSQFDSELVLAFASIALVLAAAGLYDVLAYLVAQHAAEFGIRIALGARRAHVLRRVLLDGMRPALVELIVGLAASASSVRLIRSMLYETQPLDPAVFTSVAGLLLFVAIAACLAPAWRAAQLDPAQALRNE
jgi:ABC-type antimicrobial peptide transport system permease subunit